MEIVTDMEGGLGRRRMIIVTMLRWYWGASPPNSDLGASPLNSLNLNVAFFFQKKRIT
jgi:hypothetical protein